MLRDVRSVSPVVSRVVQPQFDRSTSTNEATNQVTGTQTTTTRQTRQTPANTTTSKTTPKTQQTVTRSQTDDAPDTTTAPKKKTTKSLPQNSSRATKKTKKPAAASQETDQPEAKPKASKNTDEGDEKEGSKTTKPASSSSKDKLAQILPILQLLTTQLSQPKAQTPAVNPAATSGGLGASLSPSPFGSNPLTNPFSPEAKLLRAQQEQTLQLLMSPPVNVNVGNNLQLPVNFADGLNNTQFSPEFRAINEFQARSSQIAALGAPLQIPPTQQSPTQAGGGIAALLPALLGALGGSKTGKDDGDSGTNSGKKDVSSTLTALMSQLTGGSKTAAPSTASADDGLGGLLSSLTGLLGGSKIATTSSSSTSSGGGGILDGLQQKLTTAQPGSREQALIQQRLSLLKDLQSSNSSLSSSSGDSTAGLGFGALAGGP